MDMTSTLNACKWKLANRCLYFQQRTKLALTFYYLRSTPWLTTRRRTCPICKDDVVRCLTHDVSWSSHHGTTCESPVVEDDYSRNARGLHGSIVGDRTGNNNINHFTSQTEMESEYGDFGGGDTVVTSLGERSVSTSRTTNSSERRGSFARFLRNTLLSLRTNFSR